MDNPIYSARIGVVLHGLDPRVEAAIPRMARAFLAATGAMMVITAGRDGVHSTGSLHYSGRALDIRIRGLTDEARRGARDALAAELGRGWDVILEPDHIHAELDRRADAVATPAIPA